MAYTPEELIGLVQNKIDGDRLTWAEQDAVSHMRGLHHKFDSQLQALIDLYHDKWQKIVARYKEIRDETAQIIDNFDISTVDITGEMLTLKDKVLRLADKYWAVKWEIEGRSLGAFVRTPTGTDIYIDLDNGSDASPHDGLKYGNYTADAGTGETTLVETSELGRTTDDDWNGAYLYNVTRGAGVLITDSAYVGGTWTLTHPTITNQAQGDTYYIIDAFLTIEKYTSVESRSPGDIAYVRANTSQTGTQIVAFDEDGDEDSRISIIGCDSVVNDPWGDASDVLPIFDANSNAYYLNITGDDYWWIERLDLKNATDQPIIVSSCYGIYLKDNYYQTSGVGIYLYRCASVVVDGGRLDDNGTHWTDSQAFISDGNNIKFIGVDFDAGTNAGYQFYLGRCHNLELIDCDLAKDAAASVADIYFNDSATVMARNTNFSATPTYFNVQDLPRTCLFSEDHDQVFGAGKIIHPFGTITRQTSPVTGNAVESYKMEPDGDCGLSQYMTLNNDSGIVMPFVEEGTASQQITITVKMQAESAWTTYPTASELYIEASYYDSGSDAGRSTIKSTQTISSSGTWVSFTVTMTPQRTGKIYINVYLKKFESGKTITVNGESVPS